MTLQQDLESTVLSTEEAACFLLFRSQALCMAGNMKLLPVSNPAGTEEYLICLDDIPQDKVSELLVYRLLVQLQEPT